jgi:single-strand DNA-binding protein
MNNVILMGRLTKDPQVSSTASGTTVAKFSLALDRGKDKNGEDRGTDYPNCIAFGKTAETIEKFFGRGQKMLVQGHLQTGSYEKDGHKVYTTDVIVDRFEFAEKSESKDPVPEGFNKLDTDMPF